MTDVTIDLLKTHFRQLRLPTMGQEFERLARDAAATNQTFVQFLLGLTEIELETRAANADQERGVPGVVGLRHLRLGVPIATEKKTTNLARGPSSTAVFLLETRLRGPDSRNCIRERLSITRNPRKRLVSPESLKASRLPSFARTARTEDRCFFLRCYRNPHDGDRGCRLCCARPPSTTRSGMARRCTRCGSSPGTPISGPPRSTSCGVRNGSVLVEWAIRRKEVRKASSLISGEDAPLGRSWRGHLPSVK